MQSRLTKLLSSSVLTAVTLVAAASVALGQGTDLLACIISFGGGSSADRNQIAVTRSGNTYLSGTHNSGGVIDPWVTGPNVFTSAGAGVSEQIVAGDADGPYV